MTLSINSPSNGEAAPFNGALLVSLLRQSLELWGHDATVEPAGTEAEEIVVRCGSSQLHISRASDPSRNRPCWLLWDSCAIPNQELPLPQRLFIPSLPALLRHLRERLGLPAVFERAIIGQRASVSGDRTTLLSKTPSSSEPLDPSKPPESTSESARGRTPVYVLTGFLGSGKTTVLNRLLRTKGLEDTAVIVNEFGDVGIDHLLVEASDEQLVELAGGCVCCTVRGDLALTIADLLARRELIDYTPFRRIVIETTGLADPIPIVNLLATDPLLAERTVAAGIATTLDTPNALSNLRRFPEANRQAILANWLILTKTDLIEPAPALLKLIRNLNPDAALHQATADGVLDISGLFSTQPLQNPVTLSPPARRHAAHLHTNAFSSVVISRRAPVPAVALTLLIQCLAEQLGSKLLRVKGLVQLVGIDRPALVQGAQHVFHPVDLLQAWPKGHSPGTQLVFITQDLNTHLAHWLENLLEALCEETQQMGRYLDEQAI